MGVQLKDIDFADLMIIEDQFFLRHVKGVKGPLSLAPKDVCDELLMLKKELDTKQESEFLYLHRNCIAFRVARVKTIKGDGYFLRRPKWPVAEFSSLGFPVEIQEKLVKLGEQKGMILFAGATGSGKSTSMYSLQKTYLDSFGDICVGIEDPVEIPMQGMYGNGYWYQIEANNAGGYERAMISAMRYNPKYVMLGEIRSPSTANEAIRAAVNGHVVLTTIHGNSVVGAILALQQLAASASNSGLASSILADGLLGVVHQKLVPGHIAGTRRLKVEALVIDENDHGLKSKIRQGKVELLSTDIAMQNKVFDI